KVAYLGLGLGFNLGFNFRTRFGLGLRFNELESELAHCLKCTRILERRILPSPPKRYVGFFSIQVGNGDPNPNPVLDPATPDAFPGAQCAMPFVENQSKPLASE